MPDICFYIFKYNLILYLGKNIVTKEIHGCEMVNVKYLESLFTENFKNLYLCFARMDKETTTQRPLVQYRPISTNSRDTVP